MYNTPQGILISSIPSTIEITRGPVHLNPLLIPIDLFSTIQYSQSLSLILTNTHQSLGQVPARLIHVGLITKPPGILILNTRLTKIAIKQNSDHISPSIKSSSASALVDSLFEIRS